MHSEIQTNIKLPTMEKFHVNSQDITDVFVFYNHLGLYHTPGEKVY
jgi:hypothetical protein